MVSQKSRSQVFYGMDFRCIHNRFKVWAGHAKIEGGDGGFPCHIFAGNIEAWEEGEMINGKTGDFFHNLSFLLSIMFICEGFLLAYEKANEKISSKKILPNIRKTAR